jgi:hypothetical protein
MQRSHELDQPWARLAVLRGPAPHCTTFHAGQPREPRIGSAPGAHLQLPATCAAPQQLEVFWDGAALWLQDCLRLGTTLVQGRPLAEWSLVRGHVIVAFGAVRLWVAAASPHPIPDAPDLSFLDQTRGNHLARRNRRMPTLRLRVDSLLRPEPLSEAAGS